MRAHERQENFQHGLTPDESWAKHDHNEGTQTMNNFEFSEFWADMVSTNYADRAIKLDAFNYGCDEQTATELAVIGFMCNV